jgi:hypothetical protein
MSLSSGLPSYKKNVNKVFQNNKNSSPAAGMDIGSATKEWAIGGVPMTVHTGTLAPGQTVAGFVTSTPGTVSGSGLGGVDSSSPGTGLASAKASLISSLTTLFANTKNTPDAAADGLCDAINSFFAAAKVMTSLTATIPPGVSVPGPAGPVGVGSYTGTESGGIDSSSPGAGLSNTLPTFQNSLGSVFSNNKNTPSQAAQGIADACETFFLSAIVSVSSATGTAGGGPATVDTNTGSGVTNPPGSSIISGSGSGTLS